MSKKQELIERAEKLMKQVDTGKITGKKKIFKARKLAASLRFRAKKYDKKSAPGKAKISKRAPKPQFDASQGFLPNFLKSMNMVRVEELVAEKLFRTLLGAASDQVSIGKAENEIAQAVEITFPSDRKKKVG